MAQDRRDRSTIDIFSIEWANLPAVPVKKFRIFDVEPGNLTEEQKDEITRLAEDEGMASWSIARRIKKHPSTVAWFMWGMGLKKLGEDKKRVYTRGGRAVVPFSKDEDAFIVERRIAGDTPVRISALMRERFPHPRSRDTIASRLMMLASDEAAREAS